MSTYPWYESYKAAVLETDWTKMQARVQAARHEIDERRRILSQDHGGTPEEREALEDAMRGLRVLGNDAAEWRGRQSSVPPSR